ncbi:hypothetical protein [Microbacterium sediminis]|uniref:Uncharacterized protein n=1 Tax=Microbacterium sediminis TaxID=904291 RepID=A0A1B9NA62_9MICO|nr:hypothetical protein [Microbacterium sediminis]OCG73485.1 hypothetical protein A7J15_07285 [Microbacterium sediminis]QBR73153.1 hypothetical protein E3O41_01000 [Microbacterium sediminis]
MSTHDLFGTASIATTILHRAADDLQVAALTLAQAARVAVWESPAGDLARERLREHEELARRLEDQTLAAVQAVWTVVANAEN